MKMRGVTFFVGFCSLMLSTSWLCDACLTRRWHRCSNPSTQKPHPDRAEQVQRFTSQIFKKLLQNIKTGNRRINGEKDAKIKRIILPATTTTVPTTTTIEAPIKIKNDKKLQFSKDVLSMLSYMNNMKMQGEPANSAQYLSRDNNKRNVLDEDPSQLNDLIRDFLTPEKSSNK